MLIAVFAKERGAKAKSRRRDQRVYVLNVASWGYRCIQISTSPNSSHSFCDVHVPWQVSFQSPRMRGVRLMPSITVYCLINLERSLWKLWQGSRLSGWAGKASASVGYELSDQSLGRGDGSIDICWSIGVQCRLDHCKCCTSICQKDQNHVLWHNRRFGQNWQSLSAWLEGISGWNVAGAPNSGSFGIDGREPVFEGLFDTPLHGIQIDLAVALNIDVFIKGKLKCLGDIVESDSVGIDSRIVWCWCLGEIGPPMESSRVLGIVVLESRWWRTILARGIVIFGQEDDWGVVIVGWENRHPYFPSLELNLV